MARRPNDFSVEANALMLVTDRRVTRSFVSRGEHSPGRERFPGLLAQKHHWRAPWDP